MCPRNKGGARRTIKIAPGKGATEVWGEQRLEARWFTAKESNSRSYRQRENIRSAEAERD